MLNKFVRFLGFIGLGIGTLGLVTMGTGLAQISNSIARMFMLPGVAGFAVIAAIGGYIAYHTGQVNRKLDADRLEQAVIQALRSRKGQTSPIELASDVGLSLKEAEAELNQLVADGHGHVDLTEDMRKVYIFPAFEAASKPMPPPPPAQPSQAARSMTPNPPHSSPENEIQ